MTKTVFVEKSREVGEEFVEISKGMLKSQNYAIAIEGKNVLSMITEVGLYIVPTLNPRCLIIVMDLLQIRCDYGNFVLK